MTPLNAIVVALIIACVVIVNIMLAVAWMLVVLIPLWVCHRLTTGRDPRKRILFRVEVGRSLLTNRAKS